MNRCALVTVVMRRVSAGSLFGASLFSPWIRAPLSLLARDDRALLHFVSRDDVKGGSSIGLANRFVRPNFACYN